MDGTARVEPGGGSPDPAGWSAINDPEARLRTALGEVYSYYGRAETMLARAEQEAPANPILTEVLGPYAAAWDRMRDVLTEGWRGGGDIVIRAAVGQPSRSLADTRAGAGRTWSDRPDAWAASPRFELSCWVSGGAAVDPWSRDLSHDGDDCQTGSTRSSGVVVSPYRQTAAGPIPHDLAIV